MGNESEDGELANKAERVRVDKWKELRRRLEAPELRGWAFRGQSRPWALKSSLDRAWDDYYRVFKDETIWPGPAARSFQSKANAEIRLIREFQRRYQQYAKHPPEAEDWVEWLSIMRHYGAPTRLLDFTYSPYVAVFNALEDARMEGTGESEENPVIWALDLSWARRASLNAVKACPERHFGLWYLLHGDKCVSSCEPDEKAVCPDGRPPGEFKEPSSRRIKSPRGFGAAFRGKDAIEFACAVNPERLTERLTIQKGLFLCPGDVNATAQRNLLALEPSPDHLKRFELLPSVFSEAFGTLHHVNVNAAVLYPGLEGFARSLKRYYALPATYETALPRDSPLEDASC